MAKNTQNRKISKRISEWGLNVFAVGLVLFPVFAGMLWINQVFFNDPRRTITLKSVSAEATSPRLFEEPLISITFDDGWESVYTNAAPVLGKYDIASTHYILPGLFKNHQYLSYDQAYSLKKAGHEIASHTMSHPNLSKTDFEESKNQLHESDDFLQKNGLADDLMSFASPEGATTPRVIEEATRIYGSHRNINGDLTDGVDYNDVNVAGKFDRFNIIGFSVRPSTTDAEIKAAIDYTHANNGWLVLAYHQIDHAGEPYSTSPKALERHLIMIKNTGIKTPVVRAVIDNYKKVGW